LNLSQGHDSDNVQFDTFLHKLIQESFAFHALTKHESYHLHWHNEPFLILEEALLESM